MPEQIKKSKSFKFPIYLSLSLCLALLIVGLSYFYSYFIKERTITVVGRSYSKVQNKIAVFNATVMTSSEDKTEAVEEASQKSNAIVDAVKVFGILPEDIKTANLNVYQREDPVLEKGVQVYRPGDWYASYSVEITLRDLEKSTEFTALLNSFEETSLYGPNLQTDNKLIDESALLKEAVQNAQEKAKAIAKQVGRHVEGVQNIVEGSSNNGIYANYAKAEGLGGGGGFPIEAGSSDVSKYATVTFIIR